MGDAPPVVFPRTFASPTDSVGTKKGWKMTEEFNGRDGEFRTWLADSGVSQTALDAVIAKFAVLPDGVTRACTKENTGITCVEDVNGETKIGTITRVTCYNPITGETEINEVCVTR